MVQDVVTDMVPALLVCRKGLPYHIDRPRMRAEPFHHDLSDGQVVRSTDLGIGAIKKKRVSAGSSSSRDLKIFKQHCTLRSYRYGLDAENRNVIRHVLLHREPGGIHTGPVNLQRALLQKLLSTLMRKIDHHGREIHVRSVSAELVANTGIVERLLDSRLAQRVVNTIH